MNSLTETEPPKVELANKDWALRELMDTERRFEKAFHEQTIFLKQETDSLKQEISSQTRWLVGMAIAIILAVLFKG